MSDAVATELSLADKAAIDTETLLKTQRLERIISPVDFLDIHGRLTDKGRKYLSYLSGNSTIKRIGGGTSKEAFSDNDNKKVFSLVQTTNQVGAQQARNQVRFYEEFSQDPDLQETVVLPTKIIENKIGEVLGTEQPFYGIAVTAYLKVRETPEGSKVTKESIDQFVNHYRQVIAKTGQAHGDFVIGSMENNGQIIFKPDLENLRIGPNGQLKFIDYNGRNGIIAFNGDWKPNDSSYSLIREGDPDRVQTALYHLFRP